MSNPIFKNRQNELVTTTDGRRLFHSRSVAVVLVLVARDANGRMYFAIEKRGNKPGLDKPGLWCLPCGYLDWDENGYDAVRREVWEEIGLDLKQYQNEVLDGTFLDQPWFVKTEPGDNRQNVTLRYSMVIFQEELPKLIPNNACEPGEVAEAVWALHSDILLGKYQFAFNHDKVIDNFKTLLCSKY